jgi:PAS domain S-box-containing protein
VWGTYLIITFWSIDNRRTGADYGLIAFATTIPLIEKSKIKVYLFFALSFLTFIFYKIYDYSTPFIPDDALNYQIINNSILLSCGGIVFVQMMIFRNLTEHFSEEAQSKFNELNRVLEIKKQTEEKLKTSNKDLQQLREQLEWIVKQKTTELQTYLDAINVNVLSSINDLYGNFVKVNEPLSSITGYSPYELVGKNLRFLNGGHPESFYDEIEKTIQSGNSWRGELKEKTKEGATIWTDIVIIPIKGKENKVQYSLTIGLPISERKNNEEARENNIKMLENIAFRASHKMRGPLARIQGLVSLVENNLIGFDEMEAITKGISDSSKELNHATSELVKYVNENQDKIERSLTI